MWRISQKRIRLVQLRRRLYSIWQGLRGPAREGAESSRSLRNRVVSILLPRKPYKHSRLPQMRSAELLPTGESSRDQDKRILQSINEALQREATIEVT